MPHRVAIFCKSFDEDFARLAQLLQSHQHHCADMPFVLSIPRAHDAALRRLGPLPSKVVVIFDEDYAPGGMEGMYGWFQQQICKLSVHKTGLAEAYVSVDSDAYFVAPLDHGAAFDGGRKRIVYAQLFTKYQPGNDALRRYLLDPNYAPDVAARPGTLEGFGERLAGFRLWLEKTGDVAPVERGGWINRLFQVPGGTCLQPGQILHASLLERMEAFFEGHGIGLLDLIKLIPWEYNWYGAWAAAACNGEVARSLSPIVHFASAADVAHARAAGITATHLAARFKVVQMAARHFEDVVY